MNKNYPLTGNVDVVFRAYSQYTLNGKTYAAGEPVAYIKDTEASLVYGGTQKTATAVQNLASFTDTAPEEIVVEANVFKDAILKMFSETISDPEVVVSKLVYQITNETGQMYLDSNITNVFIYDTNMNRITTFTFDEASGLVDGLSAETYYYVDYGIKKTDYTGFALKTVSLPYLTIELKGSTVVAGAAKNYLIRIPRAKLNMTPSFNFKQGEFATTSIRFKVIQNNDMAGVEIYFF